MVDLVVYAAWTLQFIAVNVRHRQKMILHLLSILTTQNPS